MPLWGLFKSYVSKLLYRCKYMLICTVCVNIKNNKSEAFTAVISLISLYNSVACHETHRHSHTAVNVYTEMHAHTQAHTQTHTLAYSSLRWEESRNGYGHPGHLACKRPKKEKKLKHTLIKRKIYIDIILKRSTPLHLCSCRVPSPPPDKPKTLWQILPKRALR